MTDSLFPDLEPSRPDRLTELRRELAELEEEWEDMDDDAPARYSRNLYSRLKATAKELEAEEARRAKG